DEPFHFGAAVEKIRGSLQWGADHPPFAHLVAGLPLRFHDFAEPQHTDEQIHFDAYVRGRDYLYQRTGEANASHLLWLARLPIIAATLLTTIVIYLFARDLFGDRGGLLALTMASTNPSVLAHGRLVTTDMVLAGLVLASVWLIWRSIRSPSPMMLLGAGSLLWGLALGTKFSALVMTPVAAILVAWAAARRSAIESGNASGSRKSLRSVAVALLMFGTVSLGGAWAVYLAVDPQITYEPRVTVAPSGITEQVAARLPLPAPFRDGLRLQIGWDEAGRAGFLFGERYLGGKPLFYPAMLAMKSPLAMLAAFVAGLWAWVRTRRSRMEPAMLLLVPVSFFLFAMTTQTNLGIRHILPLPLLMSVIAGGMALSRRGAWPLAAAGLAVWALIAAVLSFPSHIAYVNEAFGGSDNAYRLVTGSNVDWGQDLIRLREHLETEEVAGPVWLAYFGQAPVEEYDLPVMIADPEKLREIRGTLAISVSIVNQLNGPYDPLLDGREPFAQIGHSILLYRIQEHLSSG
ncbi:MAG TPA: glycosyltransferase family 39 protein, partial [Actinomycetota bacterium]|nr:glycosyltransferase family 39 protein [Actinomycetota bacterium]